MTDHDPEGAPPGKRHRGHQHHFPPVSPRSPKRRLDPDDDPIAAYVEWTEHRYTPGYYVGGKLSPVVRALQNAGPGGRMFGSALIGVGLLDLLVVGAVVYRNGVSSIPTGFVPAAIGLVSILGGFSALRRGVAKR